MNCIPSRMPNVRCQMPGSNICTVIMNFQLKANLNSWHINDEFVDGCVCVFVLLYNACKVYSFWNKKLLFTDKATLFAIACFLYNRIRSKIHTDPLILIIFSLMEPEWWAISLLQHCIVLLILHGAQLLLFAHFVNNAICWK